MPLGTNLVPDAVPHAVGNGQVQSLSPAQVSTKYGAGNVKTPTAHFTLRFQGSNMQFYKGIPFVITDASMAAALLAANAPVV